LGAPGFEIIEIETKTFDALLSNGLGLLVNLD
jgi:hypothetical protein